jgi:UDP-N-acetylglucosamine 2-epimerase (non-hydrolysing)
MKLLLIIGTRPEYLKCKPLYSKLIQFGFDCTFLHIRQHVDLILEEPHTILNIRDKSDNRLSDIGSSILQNLPNFLKDTNLVIVQGDTATAFYSALCAFQCKIPVAHVEAGLRTFDLQNPFPEEAYRSLISRIATFHFCPDVLALENLQKEKISKNIYNVGNTILDQIVSYKFDVYLGSTVLITVHRRENWDSLGLILDSISKTCRNHPNLSFIWVYHMNPVLKTQVSEYFLQNPLSNLSCVDPLDHKTLISYLSSCYAVITDSGGIQEEASFLGKHCFVLRKITERLSIPDTYISIVQDPMLLPDLFYQKQVHLESPCLVYGNGTASQQITSILKNHLNSPPIDD